jgi:lysophospholipase L1-like esterase
MEPGSANLIRTFQDEPLEVFNRGLPAEVISPNAPGYEESAKPSLVERYRAHCVALRPDLVVIAEGLNDMRSGMPVQVFHGRVGQMVGEIRQNRRAVTLVGIYHQEFGCGATIPKRSPPGPVGTTTLPRCTTRLSGWWRRGPAPCSQMRAAMGGASWLLNPDCCHFNDLGHVVVGNAIFQEVANRSAIGAKTARDHR